MHVGGWSPAAEPSVTQAWVALLLASLGAERARGACPLYARSPSRRLGTRVFKCCSPHAVASRLPASRRPCQRCRKRRRPPAGAWHAAPLLSRVDLFLQARTALAADPPCDSRLPMDVPCGWFWAAPPCPGRAGPCVASPAAGSARMQNAWGPGCTEPCPARRLWSRAVRAGDPVRPFPAVCPASSVGWASERLPLPSDRLLEQNLKTGGKSGSSSTLYLFIKGCLGTIGSLLTLI